MPETLALIFELCHVMILIFPASNYATLPAGVFDIGQYDK